MRRWLPLAVAVLVGCGGDDGNGTGPVAGSIQVAVSTSGDDPPGTYSLTLDGVEVAQIAASGGITIPGVSAGLYAVGIAPVPGNCTVAGGNPVQVSVIGGSESAHMIATTITKVRLTLGEAGPLCD
jgi:hypothetical protein